MYIEYLPQKNQHAYTIILLLEVTIVQIPGLVLFCLYYLMLLIWNVNLPLEYTAVNVLKYLQLVGNSYKPVNGLEVLPIVLIYTWSTSIKCLLTLCA